MVQYKDIMKAMSLFSGVQGMNILLNIVRAKLSAILLGPAGIGLNTIFNETKDLLREASNFGLDQSGTREISIHYEEYQNTGCNINLLNRIKVLRSYMLICAVLGTIICICFAYPLSLLTFSDTSHTIEYIILSPAVGITTLTYCEMTILKSTRQLKRIALLSTLNVVIAIITSVPLYYIWGLNAILPVIIFSLFFQFVITASLSYKQYKPRFSFNKQFLHTGKKMFTLGIALMIQGIIAHFARLGIQSYININGSLSDVGFFNSTQVIISTYLGIFAASISVDFFPRLSGIYHDIEQREETIHRQTDILQMFTAPIIVIFILGLNIIIPLLFSSEFTPVIPVLEVALITCLARSVATPIQYLPLAAGHSIIYLVVDLISYIIMSSIYICFYKQYGLIGIGYGICIFNIIDLLWAMMYSKILYNILPNIRNIVFLIIQTIIFSIAFIIVRYTTEFIFILLSITIVTISLLTSFILWNRINKD